MTNANIQTEADIRRLDTSDLALDRLPQSTYKAISKAAQAHPDHIALKFILDGDCVAPSKIPLKKRLLGRLVKLIKGKNFAEPYREMTYSEFIGKITQCANALYYLGVRREDVTALVLPNFPETYVAIRAAETAGISNPINPMLDPDHIRDILISSKAKVMIALGPVPGADIWEKIISIKNEVPGLEAVISLFGDDAPSQFEGDVPVIGFEKLLSKQDAGAFKGELPAIEDVCAYFHTGGTTGRPKLAKLTHKNLLTNSMQVSTTFPLAQDDTMFVGLPIFHVNAAIATGITPLLSGATILLGSPAGYRGRNIIPNLFQILNNYDVTFIMAVPTVYSGLLSGNIPKNTKTKLKYAVAGAAPLAEETQIRFTELTGIPILDGYGATETSSVATLNPPVSVCAEKSVGLPLPAMDLEIASYDDKGDFLKFARVGEVGEVVISGNNVFSGYVEDQHNENIWIEQGGKRFFKTGDLGRKDENGYLILSGRSKELIIRGGHNIDPGMIEEAALKFEGVKLAAAVGRPDAYTGELPVLYVTSETADGVRPADLLEFLKVEIPERAAIPKDVVVMDELPLTTVGKIFKPELVRLEIVKTLSKTLKDSDVSGDFNIDCEQTKTKGLVATIQLSPEADIETVKSLIQGFALTINIEQANISQKT